MSSNDVRLAIEGKQESFIQEIALNGQETWIQPLSMSEKLQLSTQKIDFFKELDRDVKAEPDSEEAVIIDEPQENPWDPIRKNIVDALQEVRVLHDVLAVLCHNPVASSSAAPTVNIPGMPPAPVPQQPLAPPPNQQNQTQQKYLTLAGITPKENKQGAMGVTVHAKKKALSMAGEQIIAGASKLVDQKKTTDFHKELLLLRQHYRLRRAGDKILGDVSYRTCGSRYNAQSTFEILRDTENEQQPLKIRLPPELRSTIWISVRVEECELNDTMNPEAHMEQKSKPVSTYQYIVRNQSFPRKFLTDLKRAQDGLYCEELFSQLCREAATYRPIVPIYVLGNTITTQIFPNTKFIIELHREPENFECKNPSTEGDTERRWFCLEQLLNKLLREQHEKYTSLPPPHPTIATMGMTRKQRTAVTKPYNRSRIMKMSRVVPLLQQIIEAAKHCELLRRIETELDSLAKYHYQPNIHVHWPVVQNQVHTSLKIHFSCSGYEMCTKQFGMHSILLNIGVDKCQAVQRDGSVVELGADQEELRRLMETELLAVQIACLAGLSRIIDWTVLSSRRGAILLSPPVQSERNTGRVAVRTEDNKIKVFIESRDFTEHDKSDVILEQRWKLLHSNQWKEVDWEKLPGLNFVSKMEQMLACLANEVSDVIRPPNAITSQSDQMTQ